MEEVEKKILIRLKKYDHPVTSTKLGLDLKLSRQTIWRYLNNLKANRLVQPVIIRGKVHWEAINLGSIKINEKAEKDAAVTLISNSYSSAGFNLFQIFEKDLKDWLKVLKHNFESYEKREDGIFEFITNVPGRHGYDRILIRGIDGAIEVEDVLDLEKIHEEQKTDEAWIISIRQVTPAAKKEVMDKKGIFVYTFDELIDEHANFDKYFEWLENEIKIKGIDKYYIDLACKKPEFDLLGQPKGESHWDEIDQYLNIWLDDPGKEHISLLGEFGTGKTWFSFHYAWEKLKEYKKAKVEGRKRPRLPVVIPLRDYAKAVSVESLFSEFFFRKHEIPLPGYSAFELLNRMGKFILIFDGFDEMARKVDYQTVVNNFWELAKVVGPGSKAILTCRTEHFRYSQESRDILSARVKASTSNIVLKPPHFEVAHIEKLADEQIRNIIVKRHQGEIKKEAAEGIAQKILEHPTLSDLVRRPILIEFILDSFPEIERLKEIDLAKVFYYSCKKKMDKDIEEERTFTSMADKVYFMCELAWEMLSKNELKLNYKMFPERIKGYFPESIENEELDHWHYDLMGQTLLIRDADGNYSFAHKSLSEFFVAYKFTAELGILSDEFMKIAEDRNCDTKQKAKDMTWTEFFKSASEKCPPLKGFKIEKLNHLQKSFGRTILTPEIKQLISGMTNHKKCEELIKFIQTLRGKKFKEVQYAASNILTFLKDCGEFKGKKKYDFFELSLQHANLYSADLQGCDFSGSDLTSAILHSCDLTDANFSGVILKNANLSNTILKYANFSNSDLDCTSFEEMGSVYDVYLIKGKEILITKLQKDIGIWNLKTGKEITTIKHKRGVNCVAFSGDGKWLATGSDDGIAKLVYTETGKEISMIKHKDWVNCVAFSSDGKWLATGSDDGIAKLVYTETGKEISTIEHKRGVNSVAFSSDGKWLATGSDDGIVKLVDLEIGKEISMIKHKGKVLSVAFSGGSKLLATRSDDCTAKLVDLETGKEISMIKHKGKVLSVAFSGDGKWLATGSDDGTAKLVDAETGKEKSTIKHKGKILSVVSTGDGKWLATGSDDGIAKLVDLETGKEISMIKHKGEVLIVVLSGDGKWLATGSDDGTAKMVDTETGKEMSTVKHKGRVLSVVFSYDGKLLATGSEDGTVKLVDAETGKEIREFKQQINCEGATFIGAKMENKLRDFLEERGAIVGYTKSKLAKKGKYVLKELCKTRGLTTSGTKKELIERILQHQKAFYKTHGLPIPD